MNSNDIAPLLIATGIGALIPALLVGVLLDPGFVIVAFVITLGHTVILGLPAALLCRQQHWFGIGAALCAGFIIGAVPCAVFLQSNIATNVSTLPTDLAPSSSDVASYLMTVGSCGGLGIIGASAFWLTLRQFGMLKPTGALAPCDDISAGEHRG